MKKSGHRDKKWSEWIYDETYNQCYRYRQGRNGEYEYVWQAPPATPTAEETRNTPKTTPSVEEELTQGLSKLGIGHDDAAPENADDSAEYEDEALQAAKLDSKRYHHHPKGPDGSGPSSDSAYYYAQTPDPLAIHEGGSSSDSAHVYAEAQGSHGKDPGGRTTPKPGDYGSVLTIQNMLRDTDLLDSRYRVEHTDKFQPGEIFKVHWAQPRGADIKDSTTDERTFVDSYGDHFHFGFRRFVVVANDLGHSQCVPILTYNGQACRKKGVKPKKHGIIYQQGQKPRLLPGEPALGFAPVKMQMTQEDEKLTKESRVNYSKLNTVEHNVKVFFIGRIATDADWEIFSEAVNYCWEQMTHFKRRRK
ncbi:hypothetical protein S40293_08406 [Stachybotrys chartarum IBT 40293]|nr:hypothetical protein S40293_08406 [Stachybotrys chartarum IBT 40293]